jgi:predicted RNase H-like nuclease (RuvC/YqgF family)
MSKARKLKEAFEWGKKNDLYNLDFPEVDWLIEQAEKVERVEKENEKLERFKEIVLEENKELTSEKNILQAINQKLNEEVEKMSNEKELIELLLKENNNLREKIDQYEKALKFYADKENYEVLKQVDPTTDYIHLIDMDEGDKARRVLG